MRAISAWAAGAPARLETVDESLLEGDVGVDIDYSSLNYKDGSALLGRGFVKTWPLVLGIDLVGTVTDSQSPRFAVGDRVTLNGAGLGESRHGGFAEKARVGSDSLVHVPPSLTQVQAAAIGTAGFTAAIAVLALEDSGLRPPDGEVLVTGAVGGTGSVATSLLASRGYTVVASTGRAEEESSYLRSLGASEIVDRGVLGQELGQPLQPERWAAAVDAVGSTTLANVLAQTRYGGTVISYGLVQGFDLPTTVLPFIVRAVTLSGANSVDAPLELRERAWELLAESLNLNALDSMTKVIGLDGALDAADEIQRGAVRGRVVIDPSR